MRKVKFGKLRVLISAILSVCLVLPFAACGDDPDQKITITPASITIDVGGTHSVQATLTGIDGDVVWTSDNEEIATVAVTNPSATTKVATITGVSAGTTTIKATAGGKSETCSVTVNNPDDNQGGGNEEDPDENQGGGNEEDPDNNQGGGGNEEDPDDNQGGGGNEEDPDDGEQGTPIYHADSQGEAEGRKDAWSYFIDAGASDVTVANCELFGDALGADNKIKVEYSYSGANWTAFNLCYPLTAGKPAGHEVTFTFKSSVAGQLTVVGGVSETFDIQAGDNAIVKNFEGALLWLRFGSTGQGPLVGSFEICGIQIGEIVAQKLAKPSFSYNAESGVITIDDGENAGKVSEYRLNFYQNGVLKGSMIVADGDVVEPAGLEVGSYKAKLVAVGDGIRYTNSDESDAEVDIEVKTELTTVPLRTGTVDTALANRGEWIAWIESGLVSATEYVQDTVTGDITVDFTYLNDNNKPWYGMRLVFGQPGAVYNYMKITITVEEACTITIAEKTVALQAGRNDLHVDIHITGAATIIGFGDMSSAISANSIGQRYVLSNIEFTDEAPAD